MTPYEQGFEKDRRFAAKAARDLYGNKVMLQVLECKTLAEINKLMKTNREKEK